MKKYAAFVACSFWAILLLSNALSVAHAQNYVRYNVQINSDGSAAWVITQAADLNATLDSWQSFQQRVTNIVNDAANQTTREMSVENDSMQMQTTWDTASRTTVYQFTWLNFSLLQSGKIIFGDIFQRQDIFSQLYGDGELEITYPSSFQVESVTPKPNGGNTQPQTLDWLGTQFFVNGNPSITLTEPTSTPTPNKNANGGNAQAYLILYVVLTAAAVTTLSAVFLVYRRSKRQTRKSETSMPMNTPIVQSQEEKILELLASNGGNLYQSAITEQCKFSKAKTSQLLTALEKKGAVRRYKKGRDKIVTLAQYSKGESP